MPSFLFISCNVGHWRLILLNFKGAVIKKSKRKSVQRRLPHERKKNILNGGYSLRSTLYILRFLRRRFSYFRSEKLIVINSRLNYMASLKPLHTFSVKLDGSFLGNVTCVPNRTRKLKGQIWRGCAQARPCKQHIPDQVSWRLSNTPSLRIVCSERLLISTSALSWLGELQVEHPSPAKHSVGTKQQQ